MFKYFLRQIQLYLLLALTVFACNNPNLKTVKKNIPSAEIAKEPLFKKNKELFTGLHQEKHRNGNLKLEVNYLNGLKEGKLNEWHYTGAIKAEKHYKNGVLNGEQTEWFIDGNIATKFFCESGFIQGVYIENFVNGNIHIEKKFENKKLVSKKAYLSNGKILSNYVIKNGRFYGKTDSKTCFSKVRK